MKFFAKTETKFDGSLQQLQMHTCGGTFVSQTFVFL
jgi:hypothetical protein